MPVLRSIHIYPIKATGGVGLDEAVVEPRGLAHDRRWMLVDAAGTFLTQRQHARLALIQAQARPSHLDAQAPNMEPLTVLVPDAEAPRRSVRIWNNEVDAVKADFEYPSETWSGGATFSMQTCMYRFNKEIIRKGLSPLLIMS